MRLLQSSRLSALLYSAMATGVLAVMACGSESPYAYEPIDVTIRVEGYVLIDSVPVQRELQYATEGIVIGAGRQFGCDGQGQDFGRAWADENGYYYLEFDVVDCLGGRHSGDPVYCSQPSLGSGPPVELLVMTGRTDKWQQQIIPLRCSNELQRADFEWSSTCNPRSVPGCEGYPLSWPGHDPLP